MKIRPASRKPFLIWLLVSQALAPVSLVFAISAWIAYARCRGWLACSPP